MDEQSRAKVLRRLARRTRERIEGIGREAVEARVGQLAEETIRALAAALFADPPQITSAEARYLLRQGATDAELREYAAFCTEVAEHCTAENKWDLVRGLRHYELPELRGIPDFSSAPEEVRDLCRWLLRGPSRIRGSVLNPVRNGVLARVPDGRSTHGALVVADIGLLRRICDGTTRTEPEPLSI